MAAERMVPYYGQATFLLPLFNFPSTFKVNINNKLSIHQNVSSFNIHDYNLYDKIRKVQQLVSNYRQSFKITEETIPIYASSEFAQDVR